MTPHAANIIELDPDALRGYPPDVCYQASCSTCGGGYGPITLDEAKAWVRGHDFAVSREAYLLAGRYCSVHGIDLVPPDRAPGTRRYCPKCPEGSPLGWPDGAPDLRTEADPDLLEPGDRPLRCPRDRGIMTDHPDVYNRLCELLHPDVEHVRAVRPPLDETRYAPDGSPREAVTEERLQEVGEAVRCLARDLESTGRAQALDDIADYLVGSYGAPGTYWPQRLPVPDMVDMLALAAAFDQLREAAGELAVAIHEHGVPGGRVWNAYWNLRRELDQEVES